LGSHWSISSSALNSRASHRRFAVVDACIEHKKIARMSAACRVAMQPLVLIVLLASCERSRQPAPTRAAPPNAAESVATQPAPAPASQWDSSAGPVVLARGASAANAWVVFPDYSDSTVPDTLQLDASTLRGDSVSLVSRDGAVARVPVISAGSKEWAGDECVEWPTATLGVGRDTTRSAGWTIGFVEQHVSTVRLDSLDGMSGTDSARLAADLTRLASALPDDTSRTFRGIPFSVRYAYRFEPVPGAEGVVADLVRRLNQEASPLEQHTFLIGERSTATTDAPFHVTYHERAGGLEEVIETTDVLAAVRLSSAHVGLFVLREGQDTNAYALIERQPDGSWRVRWTSVHTGC